ncbi:metal-sensing transcriptional repressor [Methyloceanibacter sp.]|nr:metal-sensing transcriptional repressor [Methyloceanibacter sp.]HML93000.1 metal-sensing transcriptional repressor [Methyloceanibacter sp.]
MIATCIDIISQVEAVRAALSRVECLVLQDHVGGRARRRRDL